MTCPIFESYEIYLSNLFQIKYVAIMGTSLHANNTPSGSMGSTIPVNLEGDPELLQLREGYTERMALGSRRPSCLSFIATEIAKLPPAESPTKTIRSPIVPE